VAVCVRLRCGLLFALVAAAPIVEPTIWPTALAGHEHLAAVVIGVVAALPRSRARRPADDGGGVDDGLRRTAASGRCRTCQAGSMGVTDVARE